MFILPFILHQTDSNAVKEGEHSVRVTGRPAINVVMKMIKVDICLCYILVG